MTLERLRHKLQHPQELLIAWIGAGVMGVPMCQHLLAKRFQVTAFSRTLEKTQPLEEAGALVANTLSEAVQNADIVITMLGMPSEVREAYFGDYGILYHVPEHSVLIDMSTTAPSLSQEIFRAAIEQHLYALDAPVSGGDVGAKNGTLSIMVGGNEEVFSTVLPLFHILGKQVVYQGHAGSGQHAKMCNQIVIASSMVGMCEALLYSYKAGLNPEELLASIRQGAAGCWSLENLAPRILKKDFAPGFMVEHFIKDLGIALQESATMGLSLPGLALAHQLYLAVKAQGHSKKGTHALILALEHMSSITR